MVQSSIKSITFGLIIVTQRLNQGLEFDSVGGCRSSLVESVQLVSTTTAIVSIHVNVIEIVLELCEVMAKGVVVVLTDVPGICSCIS